MIQQFRVGIANVFLLRGRKTILVDTGRPADAAAILRILGQEGVQAGDLALILHTHAHWDHAGSTRQLKEWSGAPVAVHGGDAGKLRRGDNGELHATCLTGSLIRPFVKRPYPGLEPDIILADEADLSPFGVAARAIATPGHTAGSISVITPDGAAITGDLLMGGYLGGLLFPRLAGYHYFAEDLALVNASIHKLLEHGVHRIHVGHGGPLSAPRVAQRFGKLLAWHKSLGLARSTP